MLRLGVLGALLVFMVGCQAQAVKPQSEPADVATAQNASASEASQQLQNYFKRMVESNQQVEQRITLMQEQVIKLNQQIQVSQQRSLKLMQGMQQLQLAVSAKPTMNSGIAMREQEDPQPLQQSLDRLEQLLASSAGSAPGSTPPGFRLASAYTPKGQWVIFKYDEATGLTWMAKDGGWVEIAEPRRLPVSRYEVVLRPAAGDVKGYVAARVDQQTGESWWLKGNSWEAFQ